MSTYRTPGVYVEEIATFPPSVAEVETAIPAFIGYTETAVKDGADLNNKPLRIGSLKDYEQYFGGGPAIKPVVRLDDAHDVQSVQVASSKFCLYDSVRLFFDNGGGDCYIVSVGTYRDNAAPSLGDDTSGILGGLKVVEQEDEPTILLAPETGHLTDDQRKDFQQKALAQCGALQDRVVICDLGNDNVGIAELVKRFREIGINDLKYGAAYAPWLKTTYPKKIHYRDITIKDSSDKTITLDALTVDNEVKSFITGNLDASRKIVDDFAKIRDTPDLKKEFSTRVNAYNASDKSTAAKWKVSVAPLYKLVSDTLGRILGVSLPDPAKSEVKLKNELKTVLQNNKVPDALQTLYHYHNSAEAGDAKGGLVDAGTAAVVTSLKEATGGDLPDPAATDAAIDKGMKDAASEAARAELAAGAAKAAFLSVQATLNDLISIASQYEAAYEKRLPDMFAPYKNMLNKINDEAAEIPPSGAVAGIYARVDRDRGVWKAPANVSLTSVIAPVIKITDSEQEGMNIDVNAGKSVNAIRAFTGKGVVVWGARTLAGNDNEWRFVPVRRFFNMVEESVKKSTSWAVFEPNDANTWIKVKSMIENYLTQKWRDGALMGARPDDAFYVKIGLGITMTAQDILEGRMNVEIGMAVVRPAEFIILKFSHKMSK